MLSYLKSFRQRRIIRNLKSNVRSKKIDNLSDLKTIGVICSLDTEPNWNILYHFAKVMEEQGKQVSFMALVPQGQEINFVVTHPSAFLCREKEDFNFWGMPSESSIAQFIAHHFDLLIDTIGDSNFFSQYVALRCNANLKVVYATPTEDPSEVFDLIIRGDGRVELKDYFNNVVKYLTMIRK
ncbi:MAG: hypothetical protein IJ761_04930 [Bacteroidales bacterium]|nr:hypothetical protein [Bacteroidales bacterium]